MLLIFKMIDFKSTYLLLTTAPGGRNLRNMDVFVPFHYAGSVCRDIMTLWTRSVAAADA